MPVHIPGQLPSVFEKSLCTEAPLSAPLLLGWTEGNEKKEKHKLVKSGKITDSTSFSIDEKPFIRCFQQERVCRNVSLPGLYSMDCCQNILYAVNRRLHYAQVVWVVNQCACFGRLQGKR